MNIFELSNKTVSATATVTETVGVKGVAIVSDIVEYTSNEGRKANHYAASVAMGKGQWEKTVDANGCEILTSKPTLLIQVYPKNQKEAIHPSGNSTMRVGPSKVTKEKLAGIVKDICDIDFHLSEYTEKGASECEDLKDVLKQLSDAGVTVNKELKKFTMKTFYLLPNDDGTYYLKPKGYNPNRR